MAESDCLAVTFGGLLDIHFLFYLFGYMGVDMVGIYLHSINSFKTSLCYSLASLLILPVEIIPKMLPISRSIPITHSISINLIQIFQIVIQNNNPSLPEFPFLELGQKTDLHIIPGQMNQVEENPTLGGIFGVQVGGHGALVLEGWQVVTNF